MTNPKTITRLEDVSQLGAEELEQLREVTDKFRFRANDYYLSLINWEDENDPIRTIVIPHVRELAERGELDPSSEGSYRKIQGLQHKYGDTAVLLVSNECAGHCRYCFRKRMWITGEDETVKHWDAAINYIREHKEISNVLLTGGDALMLKTSVLKKIIDKLWEIDHVDIVRIGTRMLAYNPDRIIDDPELINMVADYTRQADNYGHEKRIWVMNHFDHPREFTKKARKAIKELQFAGAVHYNQNPIIRGVNDDSKVMHQLFERLMDNGAVPYYIFQCRPAVGNKEYSVSVEDAFDIIEEAKKGLPGIVKKVMYVMSHSTGKIELVERLKIPGGEFTVFKYHRPANPKDDGRVLYGKTNRNALWFDDYEVFDTIPGSLTNRSK